MSNMVNSQFDQTLSGLLKAGEVEPPTHLWANIELQLEREAGKRSQRLLLVYKWGIAASIAALVGTATFFFIKSDSSTESQLAAKNAHTVTKKTTPTGTKATQSPRQDGESANPEVKSGQPVLQVAAIRNSTARVLIADSIDQTKAEIRNRPDNVRVRSSDERLPQLANVERVAIMFKSQEPDPLSVLLGRLYDEEKREEAEQKPSEHLWTSVGIAAGTFDPSYRSGSQLNAAVPASAGLSSSSSVPSNKSPEPGASYAFGVSVGKMVAPRIVVTGGLTYLNQNATFTSSAVGVDASNKSYAALTDFDQASSRYVPQGYQVNSNFQYLSLPVRAGWQLVQHKIGVQINGGVSTDFFMENTLSPDKPGIASTSYTSGNSSIYRPVNFSGLFGTEFSYRVGKQYRLALSPGVRVPFGSIYREGTTTLTPVTLDLGLHFRYIFR